MPERRLIAKLKATSAVTALASTRIRAGRPRQDDALPYIVVQVVGEDQVNHSTGHCDVAFRRIQVTTYDDDYNGTATLANLVRDALSGWSDATGTPVVSMCHYVGCTDIGADVEPGQDLAIHGIGQDYNLTYTVT